MDSYIYMFDETRSSMVYSCNIPYQKKYLTLLVSHCHWSWSTEKSFLFFAEVHHGMKRKQVPFSSGNRVLWQEGKRALQTLPGHWEAPRAQPRALGVVKGERTLQGFPSDKTSACNFSSRAGMTAREHGIITKTPLTLNQPQSAPQSHWLLTSGSHWPHVALWFDLFPGNQDSSACPRSWPQHYTVVRVDSTPQDNWPHLLALVYNHAKPSAITLLQFILFDPQCHHLPLPLWSCTSPLFSLNTAFLPRKVNNKE